MRTLAQVRDLADELLVRFSRRIRYLQMDVTDPSSYAELAALLEERQAARFFYLAVASNLFAPICENLATLGLATPDSRVVLERPIGEELESSRVISGTVGEAFSEGRIYRIDHYLGKEAAHSLMILRFASVDCAAMENIPTAD